ncbi:flagellar basal body P-ring formation protein FlgA [Rhodobacteraceae bacterium RKSG542]|uniref:flagellar basal body P-ring formation chaperone FlgA n=1 Tax=Pseudovibrio flavus TaxID=2529854 RepID=UPI0012BD46B1|nr:flagellar basal body P-ring formation chaperone FlgA [Pseudovibrio flavus]MTI19271.1 flagellar basal body P-ring formation protein FlgA [Pseudovibrio flavus]
MMRKGILAVALAFGAMFTNQNASAEPTLRAQVSVAGPLVTIGDFYEGAGTLAQIPLFQSPDLGTSGGVSALQVAQRAQAAGMLDATTSGLAQVQVSRASLFVDEGYIKHQLSQVLSQQIRHAGDKLQIEISSRLPQPLYADLSALTPVKLLRLEHNATNKRFSALFEIAKGDRKATLSVSGIAQPLLETVALTRPLEKGSIIGTEDLQIIEVPMTKMRGRAPLSFADAHGMQLRRSMKANFALSSKDISQPTLVERGERVTVLYKSAGLQLTTIALARADGALGDLVEVTNPTSRKKLLAKVIGPAQVVVASQAALHARLEEATR